MTDLVPVDHDPFVAPPSASDVFGRFFDVWKQGSADYAQSMGPDVLSLKNLPQHWQNTPGLSVAQGFGSGGVGLAGSIEAAAPAVVREATTLAMDQAARMTRARALGFRTDMPLYHGSGNAFDEFTSVPTTQAGQVAPGVSTALDPTVANEFAAARGAQGEGQPQVYPLLHRTTKPAVLDLAGDESHAAVVGALRDAFDAGHDAVMLRNYSTAAGQTGQKIIIVRDANQLRSPNAAFDPARRMSPNLLAGLAGLSILPVGAHLLRRVDHDPFDESQPQQQEASPAQFPAPFGPGGAMP